MLRRANTAAIARESFFIIEVTLCLRTYRPPRGAPPLEQLHMREKATDKTSRVSGTERKLRDGFLERQRLETRAPD
jgi:hypothetical protein